MAWTAKFGAALVLAAPATALHARFVAAASGVVQQQPPAAGITEAPSAALFNLALEHDLRRRTQSIPTLLGCASPCISHAVTQSTGCQLGDWSCECQPLNAQIIAEGAESCVMASCGGYEVALGVFSAASSVCDALSNGEYGTTLASAAATTEATTAGETPVASEATTEFETSIGGRETATSVASGGAAATAGSDSSGGSAKNSGSSGSSGLSKGATIGVAVGAALGGILLAVGAFLIFWFCIRRKPQQSVAASAAPGPQMTAVAGAQGGGGPVAGAAAPPAHQPELQGKGLDQIRATTVSPGAVSTLSGNGSTISGATAAVSLPPTAAYAGSMPPTQPPHGRNEMPAPQWQPPVMELNGHAPAGGSYPYPAPQQQPQQPELAAQPYVRATPELQAQQPPYAYGQQPGPYEMHGNSAGQGYQAR